MPKVSSNECLPGEPLLATLPIRMGARRPSRRRLPGTELVNTSRVPSLSEPVALPVEQPSVHGGVKKEDVAMGSPLQPAITTGPTQFTANLGQSGGSLRSAEVRVQDADPVARLGTHITVEPAGEQRGFEAHSRSRSAMLGANQPMVSKIEAEEPTLARLGVEPRASSIVATADGAVNELEERSRLEQAVRTIDSLNMRIHGLERTERRLKRSLSEEKERLKNAKGDAEGALTSLVLEEEKVCEAEALIAVLRQDVERYRRWWLNEYYSLKVLLALLPRKSRDDVKHIAHGAHARFATFSTST